MRIVSILQESTIDYPGKYGPLVFTAGCNYKCPTCHNPELLKGYELLTEKEIDLWIKSLEPKARQGWYQGVTISGGEPTLQPFLKPFAKKLKDIGLLVKLDTNGSNYEILDELRKEKLIDYVAMDVKGPSYLYPELTGKEHIDLKDDLEKGIGIVSSFPDYEFRTTLVPIFGKGELRWMNTQEIRDTVGLIYKNTDRKDHKYFLQKFVAREEMMDEKFGKENLHRKMWETPDECLKECFLEIKKYFPNTYVRK